MFGGARGGRPGSQNSGTPDAAGCRSPDPGTGTQISAAGIDLIIGSCVKCILQLNLSIVVKCRSLPS